MTNPYKNDDTAKQKSADSPAASQRDGKLPQFDFSDLPAKAPPAKEPFKPSELPDLPPKPVQLKPLEFQISDIPPGNLARRPADQMTMSTIGTTKSLDNLTPEPASHRRNRLGRL